MNGGALAWNTSKTSDKSSQKGPNQDGLARNPSHNSTNSQRFNPNKKIEI